MNKQYTDKNIIVHTGQSAEELLNTKNDSIYIENGEILRVDMDRWKEAQFYERKTWMEQCLMLNDDRNYDHYRNFNSYHPIVEYARSYPIKNIIELGCGPFTNLRTMLHYLNPVEVHLLDPLLSSYLNHPNCSYKNNKMGGYDIKTHSIPIEEFNPDVKFDLVIMNNVLEHCYNIETIFDKIYDCLNVGGLFVFGDVYFMKRDIIELSNILYDSGHPLRLSKEYMDERLSQYESIFDNEIHTPAPGLHPDYARHEKYFIGIKK